MASVRPVPRRAKSATKYKFGTTHYAQLYEMPWATVRKYHGKNYHLDDPKKLLEEILAQKAPNRPNLTRLRELAGQGTPAPRKKLSALLGLDPHLEDTEDREPDTIGDAMEGLQREMHRLKVETDEAYKSYRKESDPIMRSAYWKTWKEMLEQWGKLAKIAPEAEREAGTMAKKEEVDQTWARTFKEIRVQMETMKRRISSNAVFKSLNPVDVELAIEDEVTLIMTTLSEGNFFAVKAE